MTASRSRAMPAGGCAGWGGCLAGRRRATAAPFALALGEGDQHAIWVRDRAEQVARVVRPLLWGIPLSKRRGERTEPFRIDGGPGEASH